MRGLVYDIVYKTLEKEQHSDALFHVIVQEKELSSRDKNFVKRLAYGTIERAIEMDAWVNQISKLRVNKMEPEVRTVLRIAFYEILYMDQIPEAVTCHEAAELIRHRQGERRVSFVNGILRNFLRRKDELKITKLWQKLSLPPALMNHFEEQYGRKTAKKIGEYFLQKKGEITLHIQTERISTRDYMKQLQDMGISCQAGHYMDEAVIAQGVSDVTTLPGYREGQFFVQDESSMLPVLCSGIQPGDTVVDVCSAPGGKALHALQKMQDQGVLSARDVREKKVQLIRQNVERMGYHSAECIVFDGTKEDKNYEQKADVILADVPCSGIGIIGKKPEIKYHALEQAESLVPIQRQICQAAYTMLKPGGVFIYSTCTINPGENEDNVEWLQENLGLQLESLNPYLPECLQNKMTGQGMLQMIPGVMQSDGFFVARLRKA